MNNVNYKKIQQNLKQLKLDLVERIKTDEEFLSAPIGTNPDPSDLAQQYASRERRSALIVQLRQQLEQVEDALHRLEEETYGKCANCGKPIDAERLEVLPYAPFCVDCQGRQEKSA